MIRRNIELETKLIDDLLGTPQPRDDRKTAAADGNRCSVHECCATPSTAV